MNYEELVTEAVEYEKEISDITKAQHRHYKSLCNNLEKGDLKSAVKDLTPIETLYRDFEEGLSKIRSLIENFDGREYMESGDFASQMLEYCKKAGVDAIGEGVAYEMFPFKVRIDTENLDVYVDRKKMQCFRPVSLINDIKKSQDKLNKASFNAAGFVGELADAYDLALLKQSKGKAYKPDSDCSLLTLYRFLTPMRRFRKDYDQQSFAFDLARLHSSEVRQSPDGRLFQLSPGRDIKKSIRILDSEGNEHFFSVIKFYK